MSTLSELAGFALLAVAAYTLFGTGVAEIVGGVELLVVAYALDGTTFAVGARAAKMRGWWKARSGTADAQ